MANANETQATKQKIGEIMAALGQMLSTTLSPEVIVRLHDEKKDAFVQEVVNLARKLGEPEPVAPPAHETIRIPCVIGGRKYLACGFLKAGESSVVGQIMLDRTQVEGTTAIDEAEWAHLYEHRAEFDKCPELNGRYLATERRDPVWPQCLSYFNRYGQGWYEDSRSVESRWSGNVLVLRRCS